MQNPNATIWQNIDDLLLARYIELDRLNGKMVSNMDPVIECLGAILDARACMTRVMNLEKEVHKVLNG